MRWMFLLLTFVVSVAPASAHFLWVVPESSGQTAKVIISETLDVDTRVDIVILAGAELLWRDQSGRDAKLTFAGGGHAYTVPLNGRGVVHGHADLGVRPSGERAYRLHYYPKTIVGDALTAAIVTGKVPIEIVPMGAPGATRLQVLVDGKPASGVDINLLLPDGTETTVQTGADGMSEVLTARGRYGAWARHWEQVSGTYKGTAFDQTRYYATLVFDTATSSPKAAAAVAPGGAAGF